MYQKIELESLFLPIVFVKDPNTGFADFVVKKKDFPDPIVLDQFASQKKELFKIQSPQLRLSNQELDQRYQLWLRDHNPDEEGTWVYYPWSNRLIHILDKSEFIKLRTSRNHYKISPDEQNELFGKTIGIIGLSVGHAVAISIATERICGKLKLADFDTIELSNLNRLKTGIHNIGINKCVVTAREIAEIDPFIEIECYTEGITTDNLQCFLTEGGTLDILIDECDEIETKIACRQSAKKLDIPVIMETSDRGMLDVERFDLEQDRPILHGFLSGIPDEKLKNISPQDRVPLVMKIVDAPKGSVRGRASLLEVGNTISTWPQLASAVTLGGGVVTDVTRRILLNQFTDSGRYYVDLEEIIANKNQPKKPDLSHIFPTFDIAHAIRIADALPSLNISHEPTETELNTIIEAGSYAPSSGNEQPWKWVYRHGRLHLFHDESRSFSFANINNIAAHFSLGAAYRNIVLKSRQLGYGVESVILPTESNPTHIATFYFRAIEHSHCDFIKFPELADFIQVRSTNRNVGPPFELNNDDLRSLEETFERTADTDLHFYTDRDTVGQIGEIVGACDLFNLLHEQGHYDYYERNTRWTPEEYNQTADGIPFQVPGNAPALLGALSALRDHKVAAALQQVGGGGAIAKASAYAVSQVAGIGLITLNQQTARNIFEAGSAMQELWLRATQLGYCIQPLFSPISLFQHAASKSALTESDMEKLSSLKTQFRSITNLQQDKLEIFLFKLTKAEKPTLITKRLPLHEILFLENDHFE